VKAAIRLLCFLLLAAPLAAQTVNYGSASGANTVSLIWTQPQVAGDTLIFTVSPAGGTFTDAAGDTFPTVADCSLGNVSIYHATAQPDTANVITYSNPGGNVTIWGSEQTGTLKLDACGYGSGATTSNGPAIPISAQAAAPPQPGDLAYAFLIDTPGSSAISAAPNFTIVNGRAAPWWGAGAYTGANVDAIGMDTGAAFLLDPGTGANSAQVLEAWYAPATAPPPVTLTFGPSTAALAPCTDVVSYDDGSPLFTVPQSFVISEQEGAAQVSIGTPTIASNGLVSGSVTVNPNFTVNGQIILYATIGGIAGLPQIQAQPFDPRQLQQGSTGICIGMVLFKSITLPKYSVLGLTP
jgi:hypothetical protein